MEPGPQDGTLLVTWQPVSRPPAGASGPVTGYAVYADGKKVTDVDSPTGDHALIDITKLVGINPQAVTVRTKSRDAQSGDSMATPIPRESSFSPFSFTLYTILSVNSLLSLSSSVKTLFSITIPLIVFHLIIIETHLWFIIIYSFFFHLFSVKPPSITQPHEMQNKKNLSNTNN